MEEYPSRSIHHVLVYPYLSVQSPPQQLYSACAPRPDKTLRDLALPAEGRAGGHLPAQPLVLQPGQPPATMINADDLENWNKGQRGLRIERRRLGRASTAHGTATTPWTTASSTQPRHLGGGHGAASSRPGSSTRPEMPEVHAPLNDRKAIPTRRPLTCRNLLAKKVVIEGQSRWRAHRRASRSRPTTSPRAHRSRAGAAHQPAKYRRWRGRLRAARGEQLYPGRAAGRQTHWQAFIDCSPKTASTDAGDAEQTDWRSQPSIFAGRQAADGGAQRAASPPTPGRRRPCGRPTTW